MFLMQAMKPVDDEGEQAMANVLAVINKVSAQCSAGLTSVGFTVSGLSRFRLFLPYK